MPVINSFEDMFTAVRQSGVKQTLVVAGAHDRPVLEAVYAAYLQGISEAILVGNRQKILEMQDELDIPAHIFSVIDIMEGEVQQCEKAIEQVLEGRAQFIMKGLVQTASLLKEILKHKEYFLTGKVMSHIAVLESENYHKLLFTSDISMIIAPDLEQKHQIILNGLEILKVFGIGTPKVGVLCAIEHENPKMPATLDAALLAERNKDGSLTGCTICGPVAIDAVISGEAARHKGIDNEVAGDADYLIMPSIEAGNIFYKTLVILGKAKSAGIITGTSIPVILTSRSDSAETKLNSIAMATLVANYAKKECGCVGV